MQPGQTINPGQAAPRQPVAAAPQPTSPPAPQPESKPEADARLPEGPEVSWSASEFIAHNKTAGWYIILLVVTAVITAAVYLLTHDFITSGMLLFAGLLFGIMGARKPRELQYKVGDDGMHIGAKFYPYSVFKSFSVLQEEGLESIWFMPLKRFMPGLSIYFAPNDGQKIVNVLSEYLPFEPRELDPVDKLMHKLRF